MSGTSSVPNTFATQLGLVPAAELDANWTSLTTYINNREITLGTLAARPAASVSGRLYFATDLNGGTLFEDNGVIWTALTSGITGSTTLAAPLTLVDTTGGGVDRPFLVLQETGSEVWRAFFQRPAFFGNSATLSFAPSGNGAALQFSLIAANGGQRVAVWDSSTTLPNVPHTNIPPTFAVHGDVLIGDIVALASNPMTYFIRANTDLPVSAVTQLFSAQKSAGVEPDGGAQLVFAPFKNGGGAVSDGFVQIIAYGGGTGASANEIQFRQRQGSATVVTTWHIGGGANAVLYPDTDNALDIGDATHRVKSESVVTLYGNRYGVRATRTPGAAFASGTYVVAFQNETYDYGGWHGANLTRFVPPISGIVQASCHFILTTHANFNGNVIDYAIRLNGTTDIASYRVIGAGASQTTKITLSTSYELATTDFLEATILSNSTDPNSNTINACEIAIARVAGV